MPRRSIRLFGRPGTGRFAVALSFLCATCTIATPTDDLTQALAVAGAASVRQASPDDFLRAFTAILVRAKSRDVPAYVGAAVKLRPDLAGKIVFAALNTRRSKVDSNKLSWAEIERVIKAAVAANPGAAAEIVMFAIRAQPSARDSIVATAIAAAPEQRIAILRAVGEAAESAAFSQPPMIGTLNPADLIDNAPVNSPEQPPSGP